MDRAGLRERRGSGIRGRRAAAGSPAGSWSLSETRTCCFLEMKPARSALVTGALPILGTLTGLPIDTLAAKELRLTRLHHVTGVISPLHYLTVRYSSQARLLKGEPDREADERRTRRREKNKMAAARCRNKKRERTEFLQKESERLELMNTELKSQIEELKRERVELVHLLNRHRPTCIVRTDSVRTPDTEPEPRS